jgi:hypothetical protein
MAKTEEKFSAANLRAEVAKVHESKGTVVAFEFQTNYGPDYKDQEPRVLTYIAVSNGETWGITNATGGGDYISRSLTHSNFITYLARPEVLSATVLVPGEAFKP